MFNLEKCAEILGISQQQAELISDISLNSKNISKGSIFFGLPGVNSDGSKYALQALNQGASYAVISSGSALEQEQGNSSEKVIVVEDVISCLSNFLKAYLGDLSSAIDLVGITGTNGKTSVASFISNALSLLHNQRPNSFYIGTLGISEIEAGNIKNHIGLDSTTPDLLTTYKALNNASIGAGVMEVSSHAVIQRRIEGLRFSSLLLTNITRDHIDYHGTMDNYVDAKAKLFRDAIAENRLTHSAIFNADDELSFSIFRSLECDCSYSFSRTKGKGDFVGEVLSSSISGISLDVHSKFGLCQIRSKLVGDYTVSNLLAAAAVLLSMGYAPTLVGDVLSSVPSVPGRLEQVASSPRVFVDYAHTPDALSRAIAAVRGLMASGRLIVVFGCGGNRDRGKRPIMGDVVFSNADVSVVTSDNPRHEDPDAIISDILNNKVASENLVIEADRRKAIHKAISIAHPTDVVLIAGKGHEDYQEILGVKHHFSDKEVVQELCAEY